MSEVITVDARRRRVPALAIVAALLSVICSPVGFVVSTIALVRLRPVGGATFAAVLFGLVVGAVGTMLLLWWWATQGQFLVAPPRYAQY